MKNLKNILFIYVFVCSLSTAGVIYAEDQSKFSGEHSSFSHKWREKGENKMKEIYSQLNLTEDQKNQLQDNKQMNRKQMKATFEKMRTLKESFHQELMKSDLDMNKINNIQSQLKALQSEMIDNRLNSVLEVRKILTPEQFAKFNSLMDKHRQHEKHSEEEK